VANGDRVASTGICRVVHIFIDQEEFIIDLFVIPLEGYDMVLGVHWMRSLGPIWWDFGRTRLYCWCDDNHVVWQGVATPLDSARMHSLDVNNLMLVLLQEFEDVSATLVGLPPPRRHNHRIHLLSDTAPVAVHPYRYPQLIKDELEC
jgi:hypothetical protein